MFMKNICCRDSIKAHLQKTKDAMPQGLMREVMETYKPHILGKIIYYFRESQRKFPLPETEIN